jgi:hypothetical protein
MPLKLAESKIIPKPMQNLFETQTKTNRIRQQKIRTFRSEVSWVMQAGRLARGKPSLL